MKHKKIYGDFVKLLKKELAILPDKNEENVHNTISALWHTASGNPVSPITAELMELPSLLPSQFPILEALIKDRISGVPLAHLTGRQHFMGLDYIVERGHYIPRKETELLAETSIKTISENFSSGKPISVIDLCTGIGTVALAIAHYCKNADVYGSDIYKPAIDAAKINANHFSLENRASFFNGNMFEPFESLSLKDKLHIIVSAPPYISTAKVKNMAPEISNHEPEEAFDAGPFGLSIFLIIISTAPEYLTIGGYLIIECGLGQGEFLADRIGGNEHFGSIEKIYDKNGKIRVLKAKKIK